MDNLTHTAMAAFLSRIGPGRWTPYGTAIILIAANLPDIDVVSAAGGSLNYLHFHRHLTHSLAAMPFVALAAMGIVRIFTRKPLAWPGAYLAALLAVASHLALDSTNVYGVRLLLPFSSAWHSLDITAVVDLWILAICLLGLAAPLIGHLVGSEITSGSCRTRHFGRGWAWFAIGFVLSYQVVRFSLHSRAVVALGSQLYQESVPLRVAALPNPINPMRWRGLVETSDSIAVQEVNLAGEPAPARPLVFHKPEPDPAIEIARRTDTFQQFLQFSQWPLWRVTPYAARENARLVEVFDLRFGTPIEPGFMVSAVVDSRGQVVESGFRFGGFRPR
jgi:inner membrane protein